SVSVGPGPGVPPGPCGPGAPVGPAGPAGPAGPGCPSSPVQPVLASTPATVSAVSALKLPWVIRHAWREAIDDMPGILEARCGDRFAGGRHFTTRAANVSHHAPRYSHEDGQRGRTPQRARAPER